MSSETRPNSTTKVVVATTVALSFISFWRAAAVVLSDLASSAFYAGGIAEHAIGKSAAWFILAVMLFSFAVRSVYLESCSMFVRGGVYIVVRDAMGHFMARLSVSALMFDYILTGPISVVSAGLYLGRLLNEFAETTHMATRVSANLFAAGFGMIVTTYFWRSNIKGIHESSGKALRIMQITTVMVVAFLVWCPITLLLQRHHLATNRRHSRDHRFRPLPALHERLRDPRPGLSRNRLPQDEELDLHRQSGLRLCRLLHRYHHRVRRHDHPRLRARAVQRQPARRARHVPCGTAPAPPGVPCLRGIRRRADSLRRGQHLHHRRQRRH